VNQIPLEEECASLRQMLNLDFSQPLEVHESRWQRLVHWTPTDAQLRRAADRMRRAERILDNAVKVVVVLIACYLIGEIIWAFWPGHIVSRVTGGLR
jgi:hypothetical protein